ncbi:ABC transporter ATP-binding protein [Salegentibacter sp. F188]|uniref:ABC transporter ATP-binding protein n=1 Tax=Autumnicola patrickiae TaxID=3075591 RepID=A0ABU3E349_9FLAO|nr:ABC transporter ATP-binding protein [Salegentibacter sp. F188]MDT0690362.1 ABC transporter ATP-binding protein [Salegentibacter sp. F188]
MLKLKNVSFAYAEKPILKNITFEIEQGEHVSVIGESGCGKSTLLQVIYGLHDVQGKILWNEEQIYGPAFNLVPGHSFMKYLAQDFDLMPPLTVAENVGKYLSNMYPVIKKRRIAELLEVVEMTELRDAKAKNLSGGQQQRVALARALAKKPELILLDEPFSHIDQFRKNNLRRRLFDYLKKENISCIVATHDSTDALSFADKTIVLKNQKIFAEASPQELYKNPPNIYVASLFGDVNEVLLKNIKPSEKSKKKIILYPEEIKFSSKSEIKARVKNAHFHGNNWLIEADLNGQHIFFVHSSALNPGRIVGLQISEKLIESRC